MVWITHPLIRPESLESRAYQLSIAMHALDGHTIGTACARSGSPWMDLPDVSDP